VVHPIVFNSIKIREPIIGSMDALMLFYDSFGFGSSREISLGGASQYSLF
jgi:hypothetical protein